MAQGDFTTIDFTFRAAVLLKDLWGEASPGGFLIYAAAGTDGLSVYSSNGLGGGIGTNTFFINEDDQGGDYQGVHGDGTFIYTACGADGLRSYSLVDSTSGEVAFIDVDKQGAEDYRNVWSDGKFVYVACGNEGLRSYSVDSTGNLTFIDVDYHNGFYTCVWGDGNLVYAGSDSGVTGGLKSYQVDDNGFLTRLDSDKEASADYKDIWGDGTFLYVANGSVGLQTYSVDSTSGILTFIDEDNAGFFDQYNGVWGDSEFIYCATDDGFMSYTVDGSGNLTFRSQIYNGFNFLAAWADDGFGYSYGSVDNGNLITLEAEATSSSSSSSSSSASSSSSSRSSSSRSSSSSSRSSSSRSSSSSSRSSSSSSSTSTSSSSSQQYCIEETDDDFTAAIGETDSPNPFRWSWRSNSSRFDWYRISLDKLRIGFDSPTVSSDVFYCQLNYELRGSFDIQIDWDIEDFDNGTVGLQVRERDGNSFSSIGYVWRQNSGGGGGTDTYEATGASDVNTVDGAGKFRITRSFNSPNWEIKVYYWTGANWVWDGDLDGHVINSQAGLEAILINLFAQAAGDVYNVEFDNLILNSSANTWWPGCCYNDNFSGTNFDPPSSQRWEVLNGDPYIIDNRLRLFSDSTGVDTIQDVETTSTFGPTFDEVRIEWEGITMLPAGEWYAGMRMENSATDYYELAIGHTDAEGIHIRKRFRDAPNPEVVEIFAWDGNSTGAFRFSKSQPTGNPTSSLGAGYAFNGGWVGDGEFALWGSGASVSFVIFTESISSSFASFRWDNFNVYETIGPACASGPWSSSSSVSTTSSSFSLSTSSSSKFSTSVSSISSSESSSRSSSSRSSSSSSSSSSQSSSSSSSEASAFNVDDNTEDGYITIGSGVLEQHNFGGSRDLIIGGEGSETSKSLIRFDLSELTERGITSASDIESATLSFKVIKNSLSSDTTYSLHRVKKYWRAGDGHGGIPERQDVSWKSARTGIQDWGKPGAGGNSDKTIEIDSVTISSGTTPTITFDVTDAVKYEFTNDQYFGYILQFKRGDQVGKVELGSLEYSVDRFKPTLRVEKVV